MFILNLINQVTGIISSLVPNLIRRQGRQTPQEGAQRDQFQVTQTRCE